jgi:HPt (histidine-containing phosphotransfer) domain-containing protein
MNKRTSIDLIHEMASEVALAKELDKSLVERLSALFKELESEFSTADDSFRESVLGCRFFLSGIVDGKSNDVDADIAMITRSLIMMYQTLRRRATSRSDGDSVFSSRSSKGGFVLPEGVDEDAFRDTIASLRIVLEEIERNLVEEVVVDFLEQARGNSEEEFLRDRFHAIKRVARMLGILDIERVCVAAEEFLNMSTPGVDRANRCLEVKDWIARALDSYVVFKFPGTPYTKIIAHLDASIMTNSGEGMDDDG